MIKRKVNMVSLALALTSSLLVAAWASVSESSAFEARRRLEQKAEGTKVEGAKKYELWAWGRNNAGQLGVVDLEDRFVPTLVSVIQGKRVRDLAVGGSDTMESHSLVLMSSNKLYSTGDNSHGQLGLGDDLDRESVTPIPKVFSLDFVSVATGESHSLALTKGGDLYAWGSNQHGQLGFATASGAGSKQTTIPEIISTSIFDGVEETTSKFVGVACGARHSLAWTSTGEIYAWGSNAFGQLGTGAPQASSSSNNQNSNSNELGEGNLIPTKVKLSTKGAKIVSVVSGGFHNLMLTEDGNVYAWGNNNHGQLGLGKKNSAPHRVYAPTKMATLDHVRVMQGSVRKIVAGSTFSVLLTTKGELFGFGDNSALQLGGNAGAGGGGGGDIFEPTKLFAGAGNQQGLVFKDVSCGKLHCVAAADSNAKGGSIGQVFAWGTNSYGQLGLGLAVKRSSASAKPQRVGGILENVSVERVVASATGSYAISTKGELFAWGKNNAGQLGLRSTKNPKSLPEIVVEIDEESTVLSMSAGGAAFSYEAHSAVVMSSKEVYTWGWNIFGQLGTGIGAGTGTQATQGIPRGIPWLARKKLKSIVCGQFSTAAVTQDGELYMWGLNEAGQLGRGDFSASTSDPTRVSVDGRVLQVSIGYGHVLALTVDGRVFSWGKNFYGQLGLGDHRDKSLPQHVSHLEEESNKIVQVEAGMHHSLALTESGQVFAWGYNRDYELGLNDNMDRVLPQELQTLKGRKVTSISAGSYHNLALTDEGSLFSWGLNNYSQLGRIVDKVGKFPAPVSITTGLSGNKQGGRKLKPKKIAAGTWHSLAIVESGQVYAWGRCHFGAVGSKCKTTGSGVQGSQQFPGRIVELEDKEVIDITAGAAHSLAVAVSNAN